MDRGKRLLVTALIGAILFAAAASLLPGPTLAAGTTSGPVYGERVEGWYFNCIHVVRFGENLTMLAARYHTTVFALMQANFIHNPNLIFVGMPLRVPCAPNPPPGPCVRAVYVVQPGDDLFRIALRYGTNAYTLAVFNGLSNPNFIFVGERISIPCSSYPPPPPAGNTVGIANIEYHPPTLTIRAGQAVTWRNTEESYVQHTTTSGSCTNNVCTQAPGWDSEILTPGHSFSHTFNTAGSFTYYCEVHGAAMQGTIVVNP